MENVIDWYCSDSSETLKILFGSLDKKNAWLDTFQETLSKFSK